ncbi:ImmA/IrrE family metallo-endopeptidase [Aeromicrobium endophyticum]|nr:ImmA/IrrE family metallo-endopeptidase [Aeromicrobium endophyticum]
MTTNLMHELLRHAADLEVDIVHCYLDGKRGCYRKGDGLILLDHGLTTAQVEFTLAHELAHVVYDDTSSTPRIERRADIFAAGLVIDTRAYRRAEWSHGCDAGTLAHELGTTKRAVESWRIWYEVRGRRLEAAGAIA